MNIVILAGGTGSQALQQGLVDTFGTDVKYTVITNLFDNGLSTGECRKLCDGKLLGPSDLRKNQLLRHKLMYGETELYKFLNKRVDFKGEYSSIADIIEFFDDILNDVPTLHSSYSNVLRDGIKSFHGQFYENNIDLSDFSVANIIYTGLAFDRNYSLSSVANLMSVILQIPSDAVLVTTDEPAYLIALTDKPTTLRDEGDIVKWNNKDDVIVDIGFTSTDPTLGKDDFHFFNYPDKINPVLSQRCKDAILNADLIISSSGTQWSSLIPTYVHDGFYHAYSNSNAKKYVIMNVAEDGDSFGVNNGKMYSIINGYLKHDKEVKYFFASDANEDVRLEPMPGSTKPDTIVHKELCGDNVGKHDPKLLVRAIFDEYWNIPDTDLHTFIFDYDDTLKSRDSEFKDESESNLKIFSELASSGAGYFAICTGNSFSRISDAVKNADIYANRGASVYIQGELYEFIKEYKFTQEEASFIYSKLLSLGIDTKLIGNRDDVIIEVRPVELAHTRIYISAIYNSLPDYHIEKSGKSTIEITKHPFTKYNALSKHIHLPDDGILYVGDEPTGNDKSMSRMKNVIWVNNVSETNFILRHIRCHRLY